MAIAQQAASVAELRRSAIAEAMAKVRAVEETQGVTRASLRDIRAVVLDLARRAELFPREDFPKELDEKGNNAVYLLSEDADHRFALYMSTALPGKKVPPHNHTTWAVIVGVEGEEQNHFYERADDGSRPGEGTLREIGHEVVRPGTGVCLMPDDIHHIQVGGDQPTLHLHLYGRALTHLPQRVTYDTAQGTYKVFPASPNIRDLR